MRSFKICMPSNHVFAKFSDLSSHNLALHLRRGDCLQVCKHWNKVLATPEARNAIWHEAVVDFGHELITAVHTPIAWSDKRPSDEEFKKSFSKTKLDADRILRFLRERRNSLRKVVLMSSEGYWSGGLPPFPPLAVV